MCPRITVKSTIYCLSLDKFLHFHKPHFISKIGYQLPLVHWFWILDACQNHLGSFLKKSLSVSGLLPKAVGKKSLDVGPGHLTGKKVPHVILVNCEN